MRLIPILILLLAGCATSQPRVLEVSHRARTHNVSPADESVFLRDRASHVPIKVEKLPAEKQREEFLMRWTPATIMLVKFQYRQVRRSNHISEQSFTTGGKRLTTFLVQGDDFINGGPVSAWRVTLWSDANTCVAELTSALW